MSSVYGSSALVLDKQTAQSLYPEVSQATRKGREVRVPLSPEILALLPGAARQAIRKALGRGGMEAFLVVDGDDVRIVIRNRRRY